MSQSFRNTLTNLLETKRAFVLYQRDNWIRTKKMKSKGHVCLTTLRYLKQETYTVSWDGYPISKSNSQKTMTTGILTTKSSLMRHANTTTPLINLQLPRVSFSEKTLLKIL